MAPRSITTTILRKGVPRGLLLKHSYGGTLTFYAVYYDKAGKSKQHKLGRYPALKLADARIKAQRLQLALHDDRDHLIKQKQAEIEAEAKRVTFAMVVEKFKKLYIEKNKLRTGKVMIQQIDILDEYNQDVIGQSFYLEPEPQLGHFSKAFFLPLMKEFIARRASTRSVNRQR